MRSGTWRQDSHRRRDQDRKSTRLNSSHGYTSYAVFCLKKKNPTIQLNGAQASFDGWKTFPRGSVAREWHLRPVISPTTSTCKDIADLLPTITHRATSHL